MKMTQYLKWKADSSKGEVFTPIELVCKILDKIPEEVWRNPSATFLDPCMGKGTFLLEIVRRLVYIYGYTEDDAKSRVYGYDIRVKYVNHLTRRGFKNLRHKDFLNEIIEMKFDVVLGNPPYQIKVGPKKTEPIWNKFVFKSLEVCKDGGFISLIHPSGWRNVDGKFKKVQNELKKYKMNWLSINSIEKGISVFGAQIRFDIYLLQKIENNDNSLTTIEFQDGEVEMVNIKSMEFIPNGNLEVVNRIFANENEEKIKILYSRSSYGSDKSNVSKECNEEHQYPCVYSINVREIPTFLYSNTNQNGHFGIPKFIIPNGDARSIGFLKDLSGQYGLTQFACAIQEDSLDIQNKYHEIFRNKNFIKFHNTYLCIGKTQYNWKTLELLKKDFWKEFIDD
jgi:16S rRNA G966 N2-methylase RsmD